MRVTILGTGYVGLTTGVALAYLGHDVCCVDKDEEKIERLKQGEPPIYEPNLKQLLDLSKSHLRFLTSYAVGPRCRGCLHRRRHASACRRQPRPALCPRRRR
jgi:UDP-glucose 6-dehydrogenase